MKLVNRYHLWASLECQHFSKAEAVLKFSAEEDGMWVQWQDYARLKAEVERLKAIILAQSSDFVRSKTADDGIKPEGHNDLAGRAVERCLELQAEVERLRKAGDGLYKSMLEIGCNEMADNFQYDDWWGSMRAWQSAKEGKPSV